MPEINHKTETKTSEQLSAEAQERIDLARVQASTQAGEGVRGTADTAPIATSVAPQASTQAPIDPRIAGLTSEELENYVLNIIAKSRAARLDTAKPQEPDWSKITEEQAMDLKHPVYIPVIEHDVPAYMDMRLADTEYMAVWANADQRRIGQLKAEGYEFLKEEHIEKGFKVPLRFDSEGLYRYHDTICMRVHKRILLGKRRAIVNRSLMQLKNVDRNSAEHLRRRVVEQDPELEHALDKGMLSFF